MVGRQGEHVSAQDLHKKLGRKVPLQNWCFGRGVSLVWSFDVQVYNGKFRGIVCTVRHSVNGI